MERQTRVSKYKELREEMKGEVAIDRQTTLNEDYEDDDFLAFLPHKDNPSLDDTLVEPLSYETLKKDNENVRSAINIAKENVGKDQYNTRLDILSKIKQEELSSARHDIKPETVSPVEPQKKMSLLEKLAAMSPEEDAEELRKYEEDLTVADFMSNNKKNKKVDETIKVEQTTFIQQPIQEEEEVEKDSKIVTILNYVIIVFIIIFVILAVFIVKQLLF